MDSLSLFWMNEKITIKQEHGNDQLLTVNEIRNLLRLNKDRLTLLFASGKTDDDYRKALQKELENYHVFNVRWMPEIWIYPSIQTSKLLEKAAAILEAARSFRKDGIELIRLLGEAYQVNPF